MHHQRTDELFRDIFPANDNMVIGTVVKPINTQDVVLNPDVIEVVYSEQIVVKYSFELHGIQALAKIALYNNLYVNGWELCKMLTQMINSSHLIYAISILFCRGKPVAVSLNSYNGGFVVAFTHQLYRMRGFGKLCMKTLLDNRPSEHWNNQTGHWDGTQGCDTFFSKCGLEIKPRYSWS